MAAAVVAVNAFGHVRDTDGTIIAGPYVATLLAELGAEVVKVEMSRL